MSPFQSRRNKVQQALRDRKIDMLLVFSPENLYYLTGVAEGHAPACALIPADGKPLLVAAQEEAPSLPDIEVRTYFDNTLERPCDVMEEMCTVAKGAVRDSLLPHQRLAVEGSRTPAGMAETLPDLETVDMSQLLQNMRKTKDAAEIQEIHKAVALVDLGQEFAQRESRVGMSEIGLFGATHAVLHARAGHPVKLHGDLLSGERTLLMGGSPSDRCLRTDDVVIVDLQTCSDHYWADTTRAFVLGKSSREIRRVFDTVSAALDRAIQAARSRVPANEVDRAAREYITSQGYGEQFPHHTGHGCGLSYYEPPLIVPNNDELLVEGMVLCLEPGVYVPGVGGIRLEQMVLITSSGPEVLSRAPIGLTRVMA